MICTITVPYEHYDTRMYCNLVYAHAGDGTGTVPLRFHMISPRVEHNERFPLLIYVGGGGWRVSNPERHLPELAFYAANGFVVASVEYRTTAVARFPAQIEDVRTAIRFLRRNAGQFHIDPERIYMMGGSAGAYLTAMAALTGDADDFRGRDNPDISDMLQGVICLYGLYDLTPYVQARRIGMEDALPVTLFLPDMNEDTAKQASPASYIDQQTLPFLLLHGNADRMVDYHQSITFHEALERKGCHSQICILDGAGHADPAFGQPMIQNMILDFIGGDNNE